MFKSHQQTGAHYKVMKPPPAGLRQVRRHWPLLLAWMLFLAAVALLYRGDVQANGGHFVYALDDPYIHLAIARNFAYHGVWGVNRANFSSCSSSPLWTFALAFSDKIAGDQELMPLALNIVLALASLLWIYIYFRRREANPILIFAVLAIVAFVTPLPALALVGMEHTLQILTSIAFVSIAARALAQSFDEEDNKPPIMPRDVYVLIALAPLVTSARYEGTFIIAVTALLLLERRRWLHALSIALAGAAPLVFYGRLSLNEGSYFLPNSVLLKGPYNMRGDPGHVALYTLAKFIVVPEVPILLAIALWLVFKARAGSLRLRQETVYFLIITVAAGTLHTLLSKTGVFFRYEAYVVALSVVGLAAACDEGALKLLAPEPGARASLGQAFLGAAALVLCLAPLSRGAKGLLTAVQASHNIYDQQYQTARFLNRYYQDKGVALNDIGAPSYFAEFRLVDVFGLATIEVARDRHEGRYTTGALRQICAKNGARVAIVYDSWFSGGLSGVPSLPGQWKKEGQWTIPDNLVCGNKTISFYGLDPLAAKELRAHILEFEPILPPDVQRGAGQAP